jgi:hypothetical protein
LALAGALQPYADELDKNWLRWGLGPLVEAAHERRLIDAVARDGLARLTEVRKVSAHFKPSLTPNSILARAMEHRGNGVLDHEDLLDEILRTDAAFAVRLATALILGGVGFYHVRMA